MTFQPSTELSPFVNIDRQFWRSFSEKYSMNFILTQQSYNKHIKRLLFPELRAICIIITPTADLPFPRLLVGQSAFSYLHQKCPFASFSLLAYS